MRTVTVIVLGIVIALFATFLTWLFFGHVETTLRLRFADDQTQIFEDMTAKATAALNESPPDVPGAVASLVYVRNYYPSGTKQEAGSPLDRIVERSRTSAESRIIEKLRETTGEDLGDDADAWIEAFEDRHDAP